MRKHGVEFNPDLVQQWGHVHSTNSLSQNLDSFQGVRSNPLCPFYRLLAPLVL
jgi:hypothetical protein